MYRISHRSKKLSIIESTPLLYGQRLQELKLIIAMEFLMILDYFDYYMDTSAKSIICGNYRSLISKSCLLNMLHEIPWFIWFKCNNLAIMTNSAKLRTLWNFVQNPAENCLGDWQTTRWRCKQQPKFAPTAHKKKSVITARSEGSRGVSKPELSTQFEASIKFVLKLHSEAAAYMCMSKTKWNDTKLKAKYFINFTWVLEVNIQIQNGHGELVWLKR